MINLKNILSKYDENFKKIINLIKRNEIVNLNWGNLLAGEDFPSESNIGFLSLFLTQKVDFNEQNNTHSESINKKILTIKVEILRKITNFFNEENLNLILKNSSLRKVSLPFVSDFLKEEKIFDLFLDVIEKNEYICALDLLSNPNSSLIPEDYKYNEDLLNYNRQIKIISTMYKKGIFNGLTELFFNDFIQSKKNSQYYKCLSLLKSSEIKINDLNFYRAFLGAFDPETKKIVCNIIKNNSTIKKLNFSGFDLRSWSNKNLKNLFKAIGHSKSLESITFSSVGYIFGDVRWEISRHRFFDLKIPLHSDLKNPFSDDLKKKYEKNSENLTKIFCECLLNCENLKEINFRELGFGLNFHEGKDMFISEALPQNMILLFKALTKSKLNYISFTSVDIMLFMGKILMEKAYKDKYKECFEVFKTFIRKCKTLKAIRFKGTCKIEDFGVDDFCSIFNAINDNPSIEEICLQNTLLQRCKSEKCIEILKNCIQNSKIKRIDLSGCQLAKKPKYLIKIFDAMIKNTELKNIDISCNAFENYFATNMKEKVKNKFLELIKMKFLQLEKLNIAFTDLSLFTEDQKSQLINYFSNLKKLNLHGCNLNKLEKNNQNLFCQVLLDNPNSPLESLCLMKNNFGSWDKSLFEKLFEYAKKNMKLFSNVIQFKLFLQLPFVNKQCNNIICCSGFYEQVENAFTQKIPLSQPLLISKFFDMKFIEDLLYKNPCLYNNHDANCRKKILPLDFVLSTKGIIFPQKILDILPKILYRPIAENWLTIYLLLNNVKAKKGIFFKEKISNDIVLYQILPFLGMYLENKIASSKLAKDTVRKFYDTIKNSMLNKNKHFGKLFVVKNRISFVQKDKRVKMEILDNTCQKGNDKFKLNTK